MCCEAPLRLCVTFFGTVTQFKNKIFDFFFEIFLKSPKGPPPFFFIFCNKLEFQKVERVPPFTILKALCGLLFCSLTRWKCFHVMCRVGKNEKNKHSQQTCFKHMKKQYKYLFFNKCLLMLREKEEFFQIVVSGAEQCVIGTALLDNRHELLRDAAITSWRGQSTKFISFI